MHCDMSIKVPSLGITPQIIGCEKSTGVVISLLCQCSTVQDVQVFQGQGPLCPTKSEVCLAHFHIHTTYINISMAYKNIITTLDIHIGI